MFGETTYLDNGAATRLDERVLEAMRLTISILTPLPPRSSATPSASQPAKRSMRPASALAAQLAASPTSSSSLPVAPNPATWRSKA